MPLRERAAKPREERETASRRAEIDGRDDARVYDDVRAPSR
jgi:hypothetical protein